MKRYLLSSFFLFGLALLLVPAGAVAQNPPMPGGQAQQAGPQRPVELTLVFDREVFTYLPGGRRDPFMSLVNQDDTGPRFEEIQLIGVILHPNPDLSIAVFGPRGGGGQVQAGQQQARPAAYRARRGDRLGNVRVLEIQLNRVVVAVDEFGETQTHIMELQRPGQGGL